jgi:hypothetical protein
MQIEISWRTENSASYEVEKLNIEPSELDIKNIQKAMELVKENPFINSIRVSAQCVIEYLNDEENEVDDWRVDVEQWIVYSDSFLFYCQNKWDSSDQMESDYMNLEQFKN